MKPNTVLWIYVKLKYCLCLFSQSCCAFTANFWLKKSKCWRWLMGWVDSLYCSVELYVMGCGWLARATTRALSSRCDMAVIERDHQRGSTTNGRRFWTRWCCRGGELTVDKQSLPGWCATFCPWNRQWWWGRGLIVFAAVKTNQREPGEVKLLRGHARNTLWKVMGS